MQIYMAGIHTDTGKTHVCAAFCAAFKYDYFKLIQAGTPTDSEVIRRFSPNTHIFNEGILLQTPTSPHIAKEIERIEYEAMQIKIPKSQNLIIELAGGLFSPIDEKFCMIDYMQNHKLPTILVAKYYLGSINHILLSIEALRQRHIDILCLVMVGKQEQQVDSFIQQYSKITIIHLPFFNTTNFMQVVCDFKNILKDSNLTF